MLCLVSGIKIVKIASPTVNEIGFADGIRQDVNPFSPDVNEHGGFSWTTIHMGPGSSLFIPKYWLHCIKSVGNPHTLAFSFQVQLSLSGQNSSPIKRAWASQDISAVAEEQSVVDLLSDNEDECNICGEGGKLICCSSCPLAYHEDCLKVKADTLPDDWQCRHCVVVKEKKMSAKETNSRKRKRDKKYENGLDSTVRKRRTRQPQIFSRPTIKSETSETTSSRRSSNRQRFVCGVCNINGFNQNGGREMVRECLSQSVTKFKSFTYLASYILLLNFTVDSSVPRPEAA